MSSVSKSPRSVKILSNFVKTAIVLKCYREGVIVDDEFKKYGCRNTNYAFAE